MAGGRRDRPAGFRENETRLGELLERYQVTRHSAAGRSLLAYHALLQKWGRRVNIVGSCAWDVLRPLFEEALWAAGFYGDAQTSHLDIGSGGGFPAIPMRILRPGMKLDLVEARSRRAAFLETVIGDLGLERTRVFQQRLDQFLRSSTPAEEWDCISWKGVRLSSTDLQLLLEKAKPGALFWIFHGIAIPVEDAEVLDRRLALVRQEAFPAMQRWRLSIYQKP